MENMCHVALWVVCASHIFKLVAGALASLQNFVKPPATKVEDFRAPTPMALDNLRYGNFRPTTVVPEARSLPGYGGQVEEWANYKFQVQAIEMKESQMSEGERKKLGGLALRLTERLQGPALQIAKTLGIEELAKPDGVTKLMNALETDLLPLRRQAAVELYQAGSMPGLLSRQNAEPMASYVLRREAWWNQLTELDKEVKCSQAILGEQMLTQSGLTSMEQQLVRSVMSNDLSDLKKLAATLRDQFGAVHDREKRKGKGDHKGCWGWGQRSSYMAESYMAEDENPVVTDETPENAEYDEELYDENYEETPEGPEGTQLEEDIVAWYADQGIHAQTCSAEDLELIYDTVEHETAAFYSRQQAAHRGYSVPASNSMYQSNNNQTPQERQAKVLAAKQRTRCRACGQQGHWQRDWICPKRKGGFKGKGKNKDKGKVQSKGKQDGKSSPSSTRSTSGSPSKPRVVYFSVRDSHQEEPFAGMVHRYEPSGPGSPGLDDVDQRRLEDEVRRLMTLPPERLEQQFQQELHYMPPQSKAAARPPSGSLVPDLMMQTHHPKSPGFYVQQAREDRLRRPWDSQLARCRFQRHLEETTVAHMRTRHEEDRMPTSTC